MLAHPGVFIGGFTAAAATFSDVAQESEHARAQFAELAVEEVLGANGGQIRLGSLRPKPSVLWLLGSGETAVVSSSNWSAVRKP